MNQLNEKLGGNCREMSAGDWWGPAGARQQLGWSWWAEM